MTNHIAFFSFILIGAFSKANILTCKFKEKKDHYTITMDGVGLSKLQIQNEKLMVNCPLELSYYSDKRKKGIVPIVEIVYIRNELCSPIEESIESILDDTIKIKINYASPQKPNNKIHLFHLGGSKACQNFELDTFQTNLLVNKMIQKKGELSKALPLARKKFKNWQKEKNKDSY